MGIDAAFAGTVGSFSLDVGFSLPAAATTALFGASGSGKTTLLRCMAGLQRLPGRLVVGDECWQDSARGIWLAPHRRRVGYVFQEASLFSHLDVRDNLLFSCRGRERRRTGKAALDALVDTLGLAPLLGRSPGVLSGGERQRVALGRALLSEPRLLLMDEPLSALDRGAKEQILPYFEALGEQLSIPIVYVSHDIAEVSRLANRVVVLSGGAKVAEGGLTEVLERLDLGPATGRFEAHVVLEATVVSHDTSFCLTTLEHHGQHIVMPLIARSPGARVRVRIRARDVALATRTPTHISMRNILRGHVVEVVEEAHTAYAETLIDIGGARVRARLTRRSVVDLGLVRGAEVFAMVKSIALERSGGARDSCLANSRLSF